MKIKLRRFIIAIYLVISFSAILPNVGYAATNDVITSQYEDVTYGSITQTVNVKLKLQTLKLADRTVSKSRIPRRLK